MTDKFRVGQRVKIIESGGTREMVGLEATVMSTKHLLHTFDLEGYGYNLDIQGYGTKSFNGRLWCVLEDWIVPIYDGYDKTTWDDCYWKPKDVVKLD